MTSANFGIEKAVFKHVAMTTKPNPKISPYNKFICSMEIFLLSKNEGKFIYIISDVISSRYTMFLQSFMLMIAPFFA